MTKKYTQKTFQSDLMKLQHFLNMNKYGGSDGNDVSEGNDVSDGNESVASNKSNSSNKTNKSNSSNKSNKSNTSTSSSTKVRHFKLIEADKNELNIGYVKIGHSGSPLAAAKKLFKSLCHHRNLSGENKLKCKSTFTIQETTQESKKKIFGPYIGYWKKLTEKEQKEAERAGIKFTMRSVVKLLSLKNNTNDITEDIDDKKSTSSDTPSQTITPKTLNKNNKINKVKGVKNNKEKVVVGG